MKSNQIDLQQVLSDYDPNKQLSINWLFCSPQDLPDALHRRIRETSIGVVLREIDNYIRRMVEFYGSFIPGDEVYGAVAVQPFETYHFNVDSSEMSLRRTLFDSVEELKAMWKEFAKVLVREGILPNEYRDGFFNMPAQIIRHLYEVMDRFQYQPFGMIEHPNGEMEQLLNELAKPECMRRQFTEKEWEMIREFTENMSDIDYATWWCLFLE